MHSETPLPFPDFISKNALEKIISRTNPFSERFRILLEESIGTVSRSLAILSVNPQKRFKKAFRNCLNSQKNNLQNIFSSKLSLCAKGLFWVSGRFFGVLGFYGQKSFIFKPRLEIMSEFDRFEKPFLTDKDEEYRMLIEVTENYLEQKESTPQNKCGNATEIVIREHLLGKGFNVTLNPNVRILGSSIKNDSLLLKPKINPNQPEYSPNEVDMVIEIKNNTVGNQSKNIKSNFDELKAFFPKLRFGVIILSERKGYTHEITDAKLGDKKFLSFTLVSRRIYPKGGVYLKSNIIQMLENKEMKKTGEWEKLISYLREK